MLYCCEWRTECLNEEIEKKTGGSNSENEFNLKVEINPDFEKWRNFLLEGDISKKSKIDFVEVKAEDGQGYVGKVKVVASEDIKVCFNFLLFFVFS